MKKKIAFRFIIVIVAIMLTVLVVLTVLYFSWSGRRFAKKDNIQGIKVEKLVSLDKSKKNKIEYQGNTNRCIGYAAAYAMRYYGESITGDQVYEEMISEYGVDEGSGLAVEYMISYLSKKGYKATWYTGNISNMAARIKEGQVVLAIISYEVSTEHCVPVVGMDSEFIYLAESIMDMNQDDLYNCQMSVQNFETKWAATDRNKKSYIAIEKL